MGPGYPWSLVTAGAVVVVGLLAVLLEHRAGVVGLLFSVGYLGVCVLEVMTVRVGAVVAAMLTPPVVGFLGVVIAAVATGAAASSSLLLLGVVVPLADLFWWMVAAVVASFVVGSLRSRRARPERSLLGGLRDSVAT